MDHDDIDDDNPAASIAGQHDYHAHDYVTFFLESIEGQRVRFDAVATVAEWTGLGDSELTLLSANEVEAFLQDAFDGWRDNLIVGGYCRRESTLH